MDSFDVSAITTAFARFESLPNIAPVKDKLMNYYLASSVYGKPLPGRFAFTGMDSSNMNRVAHTLGEVLKELGILTSGHTVECVKEDLVSSYVGESANKTRELCNKALDGVLVVNDAFALVSDNSPSHRFASIMDEEAYTELLVSMENNRDRMCVIFTGLPGTMDAFLNANPGMRSRIALNVDFPTANTNNSIINNVKNIEASVESITTLDTLLNELNSLVGMSSVKEQIARLIKKHVAFGARRAPGPLAFVGNPGTGKSLVVHVLGRTLKAAGILQSGHVVACTKADLISPYIGGTAVKTRRVCESALDGILYIDEAYLLVDENSTVFELEALETIICFAEEHRERFTLIFAGYPEIMRKMFDINPMFSRKISSVINFPDYSLEELTEIFAMQAKAEGFTLSDEVLGAVKETFVIEIHNKQGGFANAREAHLLFSLCKDNVARRMVDFIRSGKMELVEQLKYIITLDDVPCRTMQTPTNPTIEGKCKVQAKLFSTQETHFLEKDRSNWLQFAQATDPTILYLRTDMGSGTAFLISPDGYAITCNHTISGANKIEARFRMPGRAGSSDSWHNCKVINTKVDLDIALIKLDGENFPYLSLAPESRVIQKGEDFILSGYPLGKRMVMDLTTFHGYVASTEKQTCDNGFAHYNINCEAKSGSSGAPVIALSDGRVIGVFLGTVAENTNGILVEEINYMRPIQYFWEEFVD